jgi:hypothetical protein
MALFYYGTVLLLALHGIFKQQQQSCQKKRFHLRISSMQYGARF